MKADFIPFDLNLSVRAKIILGFVLGSIFFFASGLFVFLSGQRISKMATNYGEVILVGSNISEVGKAIDTAVKFSAPQKLQDAIPLFEELETSIGKIKSMGVKLDGLDESVKNLRQNIEKISNQPELKPEDLSSVSDNFVKIKDGYERLKTNYSDAIGKIIRFQNLSIVLAVVLSMIFISIIGFLYSVRISEHIKRVSGSLGEIAKGASDLTKRIHVESNDEIGELSRNFNLFLDKLRQIIAEVMSVIDRLKIFVDENLKLVEEFHKNISEQINEIARISTAAEEFSSSIQEAVNNLNVIAHFTDDSGKKFLEGSKEIMLALGGIEEVFQRMNRISDVIKGIAENQKKIKDFVSSIMDITDQTNLLSLNASIEAARAGEHGKGFAVVAEEVRKLAGRTSQIAKEITQIVSRFGEDMEKATKEIRESSSIVEEKSKKASQSASLLQRMSQDFVKIKDQINSISTAFTQQERAAMEISRSITSVSDMLEQSKGLLNSILQRMNELRETYQTIIQLIKNFKY